MGIGTYGNHARAYQSFFRKEGMFNAHPALFKIMENPVLPGKIPDNLGKACGLDILGRLEMVRHQYDFFPVKYRAAYLFESCNGWRRRNIIRHHQIQTAVNQISRFHRIKSCMLCQDFLCHCHTH